MAQVLVTESYITNIASAIRSKNGQSVSYYPSQMASAIRSIVSVGDLSIIGKTINSNGTYSPSADNVDAFSDVVVNVPNTYSAVDEGKVVSSGFLVSQGIMNVSVNSIYDTTLFSRVSVSIPEAVLLSKTISENGVYDASDDSADGFSQVIVNVAGGGGGIDKRYIEGGLSIVLDSQLSIIKKYAFFSDQQLNKVSCDKVTSIGASAFCACSSLTEVSFSECTIIERSAFASCRSLSNISFQKCEIIGNDAFAYCGVLSDVLFPKCSVISNSAFYSCSNLMYADFPICENVLNACFHSCIKLQSINLPEVTLISHTAFSRCYSLSYISIPKCRTIKSSAFYYCSKLAEIWLPECSQIESTCFYYCSMLESVYLLSTSICLFNSNAFGNTPITQSSYLGRFGSIFVPQELMDAYISRYSTLSSRFVAYIEE